jgi:hypothetical protein
MTAATRSMPEWIASDITLTEPIRKPTTSFRMTRVRFEMIDRRAILVFSLFSSSIFWLVVIIFDLANSGKLCDMQEYYLGFLVPIADLTSDHHHHDDYDHEHSQDKNNKKRKDDMFDFFVGVSEAVPFFLFC